MVLKPSRQRIRSTECYDQKRRERKNDEKNAKVKKKKRTYTLQSSTSIERLVT